MPETNWRSAQLDLSQLQSSNSIHVPEQMQSIPTTTGSAGDIPVINYDAARQSALGLNAFSYGPPRLASPTRRPLMN